MSVLFSPRFQAVDANGRTYAGAQLFFYQAGTTTLITTYQDSGATTPSTVNGSGAVVADAAGAFPPIFLTTNPFKFVLTTSAGSVLDSADDIPLNDAAALLTDFQISDSALITKVDATAGAGPELDLYRNSASPAAADALGLIKFTGKNSAGNTTTYASIEAVLADPTDATEDGTLLIKSMVNGTLTTVLTVNSSGIGFTGGLSGVTVILKQSSSAAPTAEGDIQWDTDDNQIKVGDGSGTKTFSDDSKTALLGAQDQTITGGSRVTPYSLGTITTGTVTLDPGDCPLQSYTNGGAHTLAPGTNTGYIFLDITNNGSAGAITTSGWTKVVGLFGTTNGYKYRCGCSISTAGSLLTIQALQ